MVLSLNPPDKLAEALDSAELRAFIGRNAYDERDAYIAAVAEVLAPLSYAEIAAKLEAHRLWFARVEDFDDLRRNPQLLHNETFRDVDVNGVTVTLVNHPLRYDGKLPGFTGFALQPGAHSRSVLEEAGFAADEVAALLEAGAVFAPAPDSQAAE